MNQPFDKKSEAFQDFYAALLPKKIVWTKDPMVTEDYYDLPQLVAAFNAGVAFASSASKSLPERNGKPLRTWKDSSGRDRCGECCNGDRCDDETHFRTDSCPFCKGTQNAIWLQAAAVPPGITQPEPSAWLVVATGGNSGGGRWAWTLKEDAEEEAQAWRINGATVTVTPLYAAPVSASKSSDGEHHDPSPLMKFYDVTTMQALVDAQAEHIKRLQEQLPKPRDTEPRRVREG